MDCKTCTSQLGNNLECPDCLAFANSCVLLLRPMERISAEDNQKSVFAWSDQENHLVNYFVHELDLKELHLYVKRYEAFGALLRLGYQKKVVTERPAQVKEAVDSESYQVWKLEQRKIHAPKKEKKQISDYEKAVDYLVKLGVELLEAQNTVKAQFSKQGKVTQ